MTLYLIANIITCLGALGGFIYGAFRFFQPGTAAYPQMITLAADVVAMGSLYRVIRIFTIGDTSQYFHLGILATAGSLLFLFTANLGAMDSLVDDRSPELRKYRIIPFAAPIAIVALYLILILFTDQPLIFKIIAGVISALAGAASYFNLKHLIIPDVDFGVVRCLRQYNLLALVYEFLCMAELIIQSRDSGAATLVTGILMGVIWPLIILATDRGVRKWTN